MFTSLVPHGVTVRITDVGICLRVICPLHNQGCLLLVGRERAAAPLVPLCRPSPENQSVKKKYEQGKEKEREKRTKSTLKKKFKKN